MQKPRQSFCLPSHSVKLICKNCPHTCKHVTKSNCTELFVTEIKKTQVSRGGPLTAAPFFEMNVTLGHALDSGVELRLLLDQDGRVVPSPRGRIQAGHSQSDQTQPGLQHKHTRTHTDTHSLTVSPMTRSHVERKAQHHTANMLRWDVIICLYYCFS